MRKTRIFTDQALSIGESCTLSSKASHYLSHVLRLKTSNDVIVFNGKTEHDYLAKLIKVGKKVDIEVFDKLKTRMESPIAINLFQAISKNDHLDLTLQKCTELGIKSFILFNSNRTQNPIKPSQLSKKLLHWQGIVQSACEQCGRSIVPTIHFYPSLSALQQHEAQNTRIILDFMGQDVRKALAPEASNIDILLGAEGGFNKDELTVAVSNQFKTVRLGPRVLRTETAAIAAVSLIQFLVGDLN